MLFSAFRVNIFTLNLHLASKDSKYFPSFSNMIMFFFRHITTLDAEYFINCILRIRLLRQPYDNALLSSQYDVITALTAASEVCLVLDVTTVTSNATLRLRLRNSFIQPLKYIMISKTDTCKS